MNAECTLVFPGQGAQRVGMGADFCAEFPVARAVFDEAAEAVGEDLLRICVERDQRLHRTEYTQPCVLTMEIAAHRVLTAECGVRSVAFGGHSLGEYSALVAADVLEFADGVRLVRARGALMQRAVAQGRGAMAALILPDIAAHGVAELVAGVGAEVANDNSPEQLVISGATEAVAAARVLLAERLPELRFVPLRVSAPFHSRLMRSIESEFAGYVADCAPRLRADRATTVTSNFTGEFHRPETLADHLVRQISAPVRWQDNMRALGRTGTAIVEIGPSAPLSKFFAAVGVEVSRLVTVGDLAMFHSGPPQAAVRTEPTPARMPSARPVPPAASMPATQAPPPTPSGRPTPSPEQPVVSITFGAGDTADRLVLQRRQTTPARLRLFCWPFAGGKAAAYTPWRTRLPDWVELCAVELPARHHHLGQTPMRGFGELVDAAVAQVVSLTELPFAFFGHSLGALTAFEVARRLPAGVTPEVLFLAASVAPHLPRPGRLSSLSDDQFLSAVGHYGGIPPEVLDTPEVMALFLPALRSDFEIFDDYRFVPHPPPTCPVHLYGGRDDRQVAATQLEAWRDVLPGVRSIELLPGGHFFLLDQRDALVHSIADKLRTVYPNAVPA
ncbi:thioesterase domain-containing protein [Nocardia sp. NBC_00403]|uniref:thioesterase domain-containing protein n=1 Tax=Nocardia sp. NBC_00403 TaxID=2975990 RepID=UPI002E2256F8